MSKPATRCLLCQHALGGPSLDLGALPPCNAFEALANSIAATYPLKMSACKNCGLIQLTHLPAVEAFIPALPWIRYNEPEAHLTALAEKVGAYLKPGAQAYGVGPFDEIFLKRLNLSAEILDLVVPAEGAYPYLESIQAALQPSRFQTLATQKGKRDLVVCRYLLEHCREPLQALAALKTLVGEEGLALIEVPDSSKFLRRKDYSFIWEEHVCYFTAATFTNLLQQSGYQVIELVKFEGQLEDALVALVQPLPLATSWRADQDSSILFEQYATGFTEIRSHYQKMLAAIQTAGGKIALFGAGHQAIMFINALGLQPYITYLVDDDANKQGYFSPGSSIPIVPSTQLLADESINTCLLAVSPRVESKIQEKLSAFSARGGKMYSIFPDHEACLVPRLVSKMEEVSCS